METAGEARLRKLRARIEVFSAVLRSRDPYRPAAPGFGYHGFFGILLLRCCNHNFPIFESQPPKPSKINSQGSITLTGPKHSIPVQDEIVLFPWFLTVYASSMDDSRKILWKAGEDDIDQFICRTIQCLVFQNLEVNFAVYSDAVEAHLNFCFVDIESGEEDASIQVHGTVSASNTVLSNPKAKSLLFHKLSDEFVRLKLGKSIPLPLSRRMIVLPRESSLLVHVCMEVGIKFGDVSVIEDTVKFHPSSNSAEKFIVLPNHGKLVVAVTWMECQEFFY
ncbi:hypothetical protein LUZ63_003862 [Rhynchospora breviuscula]|uniref:DUF6598 domain-containing protein n=1 Tax=Rhynchospora breviuscula TaxID=2022672 RepID=A0A9Q0I0H5_9POAL|nr:hypothetical protein LUZ63_003862 [Rhynchospora breviuscula]